MVRQKRIYYKNAVYHVIFRGNNRQGVLQDSMDKVAMLRTLAKYKERFAYRLYGLVLMDNHTHLVMEAGSGNNISKIMHSVLLSFSLKFRRKYGYCGHVWQGRFKSNIIEGDRYILECLEYVHNNPVRARIVAAARDYPWSSYFLYSGMPNQAIEEIIELDRYGDTSSATS